VPAHPDDSQVSIGPIADDEVYVRDRFGGFFRIGPKLNLGGIYIKPGIELEISGSQNPETPERNYTNYPGTNQRGYGAALTYYKINPPPIAIESPARGTDIYIKKFIRL
jgi:hypothetical protein